MTTVGNLNLKASAADKAGNEAKRNSSLSKFAIFWPQPLPPATFSLGCIVPTQSRSKLPKLTRRTLSVHLSAVDFADTPEQILHVAGQLQQAGRTVTALRLCREVTEAKPELRDAYIMGLRLAEQLDDVDALQWACSGVLGQAWPEQYSQIEHEARLLARATHQRLVEEGKKERAEAFSRWTSRRNLSRSSDPSQLDGRC